ncbi:MAG: hypothetical protein ACAI44_00825 [Candidatus Sericytochromatia bacterium]
MLDAGGFYMIFIWLYLKHISRVFSGDKDWTAIGSERAEGFALSWVLIKYP